jgi:hypothetical protein
MHIGIISMQEIKNNGSYLQAYALYQMVSAGNTVDFIPFENPIVEKKEKQLQSNNKFTFKNTARKIKHSIIPKYIRLNKINKYVNCFKKNIVKYYPLVGIGKLTEQDVQNQNFDLVIVGSDEVFNLLQFAEAGVNIPWRLLGEGVKTKKIISYAAAAGQTTLSDLEKYVIKEKTQEYLSKFESLSVRDTNTADLVDGLKLRQPVLNVDPVLAYNNFPLDPEYKKLPYNYLLVYAYSNRMSDLNEQKEVKQYAKKHGLKIVCVNVFQTWADEYIVASPFALLQYIKDASCVVTDTFHGTVFSIINNTRFATFVRTSNANKLKSLLSQFGLQNRIVYELNKFGDILDADIDFKSVNEKLKCEQAKSTEYLNRYVKENI